MPYIPKILTGNLIEIHCALQQETVELVPAPIGKKLYNSGSGWGRVWKIFFIVWSAVFGKKFKIKKLKQAIDRTEILFKEYLKITENRLKKYEKYLIDLIEEHKNFSKKKFDKYRWSITEWNHSTQKFYKAIKQTQIQQFETFMHSLSYNGISNSFSISDVTQKKLLQYDKLITLEKYIDKETPYLILKKLSQTKNLSDEDERILKIWIEKINNQKEKIPVSKFHKGLQVLVEHIQEKHCTAYQEPPNLSKLEVELAKRKLKIFNNIDEKHCKWRENLKLNHQFTWLKEIKDKNSSSVITLILGQEILSTKRNSNTCVFSIVNNSSNVVIIGKNKVILGMKDRIAKELSGGIHYAKWLFVDPKGEFAVVEKLTPFFPEGKEKKWFSEKTLDKRDQLVIHPVINQITWFIKNDATPDRLSFAELMYDKNGILTSTKPKLLRNFNFPLIVNFALECSKNNQIVFKYIIKASGLLDHPYVKYFNEVLVKTFSEENIVPSDIAAIKFRITDPIVIAQAETFHKEIMQIVDATMKKLNRDYENVELIPTAEYTKKQLQSIYHTDQTICFFWPTVKKRLRECAVKNFKLSLRV